MELEIWKNTSLTDLPNEVWRDVVGYEGRYMVSNLGRVKSLSKKHGFLVKKEKIISQFDSNGYCRIKLNKDGKSRKYFVHRLVAEAFIGDKGDKQEIDHIDTDRRNNCVENLRWCTKKENANFEITYKRKCEALKEIQSRDYVKRAKLNMKYCKKVGMYDRNNVLIREFSSISEANRVLGYNINNHCNGTYKKFSKGRDNYTFRYL